MICDPVLLLRSAMLWHSFSIIDFLLIRNAAGCSQDHNSHSFELAQENLHEGAAFSLGDNSHSLELAQELRL